MKKWFVFVLLCFAALPVVAADREDVAPDHVFTAILTDTIDVHTVEGNVQMKRGDQNWPVKVRAKDKTITITPIEPYAPGAYEAVFTAGIKNLGGKALTAQTYTFTVTDKPLTTYESDYNFVWQAAGTYQDFYLTGKRGSEVVAGYTMTPATAFDLPITVGMKKSDVLAQYGEPLTEIVKGNVRYQLNDTDRVMTYLTEGRYVSYIVDVHDANRIRAILWVREDMEQAKDGFYRTPSETYAQDASRLMFELLNASRVHYGLQPLLWHDKLSQIARLHSVDMATHNFFSHTNLSGEAPHDRIERGGLSPRMSGENISYGYTNSILAHEGLMDSKGHRDNILQADFTHIGIATAFNAEYAPYITQNFMRP
ncbi:CAP domain-containing protein [Metalysinibacillus jejuensis]|uniref:CAP domain-containing protein n=1 Tax=Metalysinibacillus jejuensis TaxID=914327 RepID=UPI000D358258|nr:CAP domain-containing protein [Metalysinibacillus jejuensis]